MTHFKKYSKVEHNGQHYKTKFELHDLPIYIANSIRRSISSINPVTTFDDKYAENVADRSINIKTNTSALHDQFLSHRLSLVPINMELSDYLNIKTQFNQKTGERTFDFTNDKKVMFSIELINNQTNIDLRDKDGLISITSKNFKIIDEDGNELDNEDFFRKDVFTGDHILIDKLKFNINDVDAGEELNVECYPTIGTGKINSRYDPTGTVTYQLKVDETRVEETFKNKIQYMNKERSSKGLANLTDSEIKDIRRSFDLLDKDRVLTLDSRGNPNRFELSVESIGFMNPDTIIHNTFCSMIIMVKDVLNSFTFTLDDELCPDFTTNDKIMISELDADNVNTGVRINIKNENHTFGNMVSMLHRDMFTKDGALCEYDVLKYTGYKMQHPAIEEIDIISIPNEYTNKEIVEIIMKLIDDSHLESDKKTQIKNLREKDKLYLNTLLSVLLFIKTMNVCTHKLMQIKSEFVRGSKFNTTHENGGYLVADDDEYFIKNTDITGNIGEKSLDIDFTEISVPFNTI